MTRIQIVDQSAALFRIDADELPERTVPRVGDVFSVRHDSWSRTYRVLRVDVDETGVIAYCRVEEEEEEA